jgi:hypothetical protein
MTHPMFRVVRRLAAFIVAALFASAAHAEPSSRPFKVKLRVTETVVLTGLPPCFAIGTIQGVGHASPLGRVTATSLDCVNPQGVFDLSAPGSFSFASGSGLTGMVLVGESGERLFVTYSGTLTARLLGPHEIAGHFVITGGTGRFFGATGGGKLQGYEDISQIVSGHGEIEAQGTIVY